MDEAKSRIAKRLGALDLNGLSRESLLDEILAQHLQARAGARLVDRHQAAVADDIRSQNCGEPAAINSVRYAIATG